MTAQTAFKQIVYNYTGDRVNFGLACERIRFWSKVRCEMFINADDTALLSADRTAGRRGKMMEVESNSQRCYKPFAKLLNYSSAHWAHCTFFL